MISLWEERLRAFALGFCAGGIVVALAMMRWG